MGQYKSIVEMGRRVIYARFFGCLSLPEKTGRNTFGKGGTRLAKQDFSLWRSLGFVGAGLFGESVVQVWH